MQAAAKTSKQTMQELDIDNVDKIMGEINEQSDQMASINDALSQPLGGAAIIDEDDLEAELEVRPFPLKVLSKYSSWPVVVLICLGCPQKTQSASGCMACANVWPELFSRQLNALLACICLVSSCRILAPCVRY